MNASGGGLLGVDKTPQVKQFVVDWSNAQILQGHDRFSPALIIVNQGDTVEITFIANDTDAHTFTIGAPYNFQISDTVPGTVDQLTLQNFTTESVNNSPRVIVFGKPGAIVGKGSFIAKYAGTYEYFLRVSPGPRDVRLPGCPPRLGVLWKRLTQAALVCGREHTLLLLLLFFSP